ncbi:MAG: sugar phosphate isomerase/epimerase family protein [Pirellulales bacterium]
MAGLSINEVTTYRWTFEEDVAQYRACGIEAIGVWRQKLADFGEAKGVELLADSGLAVSNLLWAGGFTGSDGHSYHESLADARHALKLAAALGTRQLVVYSGSRNGHTQNHARRLFVAALGDLLPLAADLDVTLCVEPMHPSCAEDWTFLTDLDDAVALVKGVGNPFLKLVFDTYHWGHACDIAARVGPLAEHIGIVHLSDGTCAPNCEQNRHRLGDGDVPLACIIQSLRKAGYDGYYDVELFGETIENSDYRQLLECSKRAYERLLAG